MEKYTQLISGLSDVATNGIFLVLVLAVFLIFMVLPKRKEQQEEETFLQSLKVGDKVVTIGGWHGIIVTIDKEQVHLQLASGMAPVVIERKALSRDATHFIYRRKEQKERSVESKKEKKKAQSHKVAKKEKRAHKEADKIKEAAKEGLGESTT